MYDKYCALFHVTRNSKSVGFISISQGVDLAYIQTGISGVFFVWVLNFGNLYFLLVKAAVFLGVVK